MKKILGIVVAAFLLSSLAQAAVDVTVYRLQAGRYIRVLWADTAAELPTTSVTEGAMAWDKGTATLLCWDGAAWVGCSSGGSGAPTSAEYIVAALHAGLSAERVGTDTAEVDWDFSTVGQAKLNLIDDSIEISRLKTSDTPADGECLVYESTGDEVAFNACGGGGGNSFETMNVSAGTDPVADSATDTLNLALGTNGGLTLTGDASTDTLTFDLITCVSGGLVMKWSGSDWGCDLDDQGVSFVTIDAPSGTDPVADATSDTLTLVAGTGITITGDSTADSVTIAATGGATRRPSLDNPPSSAHAYDDEFDTTSLDAKWTIFSSGTTNAATSGTVDPTASLTTPIIDPATMSSWLLLQSDNSSAATLGVYQDVTLDTNATIFVELGLSNRVISAINEGNLELKLRNIADANEAIYLSYSQQASGAGFAVQLTVENNGSFSAVIGPMIAEKGTVGPTYAALWKVADTYYAAFGVGSGPLSYLGSVTKTGVTTLDRMYLQMLTANETPSMISGFGFVRYYASKTYGLVNP